MTFFQIVLCNIISILKTTTFANKLRNVFTRVTTYTYGISTCVIWK